MARGPGILAKDTTGSDGETFAVALEVDADAVRRARAKSDVVVGEILATPVTFEEALAKRSADNISGTISVTFETNAAGNIWRRTKTTKLTTERRDGPSEDETLTEVVERHPTH
jgi:ribosome maturation protein Sdo1